MEWAIRLPKPVFHPLIVQRKKRKATRRRASLVLAITRKVAKEKSLKKTLVILRTSSKLICFSNNLFHSNFESFIFKLVLGIILELNTFCYKFEHYKADSDVVETWSICGLIGASVSQKFIIFWLQICLFIIKLVACWDKNFNNDINTNLPLGAIFVPSKPLILLFTSFTDMLDILVGTLKVALMWVSNSHFALNVLG